MFYMRDELERHWIDPDLLGGILDADLDAISELSLRLMETMIEAPIPEKLIDWVICCCRFELE